MFSHADFRHCFKRGIGGEVCGLEIEGLVERVFGQLVVGDVTGFPCTLEVCSTQYRKCPGILRIPRRRGLRRLDSVVRTGRWRDQQRFRKRREFGVSVLGTSLVVVAETGSGNRAAAPASIAVDEVSACEVLIPSATISGHELPRVGCELGHRIGLNGKLKVLACIGAVVELQRDMTGMIEILRASYARRDGFVQRGIGVLVSGIRIKRPAIRIQRPNILSRSHLLFTSFSALGAVDGLAAYIRIRSSLRNP